jgi:hypothetical protein
MISGHSHSMDHQDYIALSGVKKALAVYTKVESCQYITVYSSSTQSR